MNKFRWISCAAAASVMFSSALTTTAQQIETLTLKQAVQRALQNSDQVVLAQRQYNAALSTVGVDRAAFRPNVVTGSGAAYTYGFPATPSGAAPSIVQVNYLQSLFNPQLTAQVQAAQKRSEVQRLELEKTRNTVMVQTTDAYLELAKVRHSLDLMGSERESNSRILNYTKERAAEGVVLPIEVTRAELAGARTEKKIIDLESTERSDERQLATLTGIPPGQRIEVETEVIPFDENEGESDLTDRAVANSLDLRQAELERRAREDQLRGEIGTIWPTVDLFGTYALFSTFNNFQQYFLKFQQNNFNIGLQIRIPILTAQRSANVSQARSELSVAEAQIRTKRQSVELDVSGKYQHLRELNAGHEVARLELKEAQENLQLVQAKFEESKASVVDVNKARIDENEKWLAFLDSEYDRQKAQLDLLNATGNLGYLLR